MYDDQRPGPIGVNSGARGIGAGPLPGPIGFRLDRNWRQIQESLAALAENLTALLLVPPGKAVFYTDGLGSQANAWARSNERITIDMTRAGEILDDFTKPLKGRLRWVEDIRPAWARLSEYLAAQAEGEVHAFVRGQKADTQELSRNKVRTPQAPGGFERRTMVRGAGSVFWEIEYPELNILRGNSKVKKIVFHIYDDSGTSLGTATEPEP